VWRYFEDHAVKALDAISQAVSEHDGAQAIVSLGGYPLAADTRRRLERPEVRVADYVDQWAVLQSADACVTHNGLNSTHELIYNCVPMISYPFFFDQPGLAARCRELGLAIALSDTVLDTISKENVHAALERVGREADLMGANLARVRQWEMDTISERPAVIQRILDLAGL